MVDMEKPVVSVLVLVYNQKPYLEQCIRSILEQETSFPFEVLVHDDASTDGSAELLERMTGLWNATSAGAVKRIRLFLEKENQYSRGVNLLQSVLLPAARGRYVAVLEGDDAWCDPGKLQLQFRYMEAHPECSLCVHETKKVRGAGRGVRGPGLVSSGGRRAGRDRAKGFVGKRPGRGDEGRPAGNGVEKPGADRAAGRRGGRGGGGRAAGRRRTEKSGGGRRSALRLGKRFCNRVRQRLARRDGCFGGWQTVHRLSEEEIYLAWRCHTSSYFARKELAMLPPWTWECWCGDYVFLVVLAERGTVDFLPYCASLYRMQNPTGVTESGGGRGVEEGVPREEKRMAFLRRWNEETGHRHAAVIQRRRQGKELA